MSDVMVFHHLYTQDIREYDDDRRALDIKLMSENTYRTIKIIAGRRKDIGIQYGILRFATITIDTCEYVYYTIIKTSRDINEIYQYLDEVIIDNINTYNKYILYEVINYDPSNVSYKLLNKLTKRYVTITMLGDSLKYNHRGDMFDTDLFLKSYNLYTDYCSNINQMSTLQLNNEYKNVFGTKYKGYFSKKDKLKKKLISKKLTSLRAGRN